MVKLGLMCISDIPMPDTSHFLPWTLDMLYQVEPELKKIAARTIIQSRRQIDLRFEAYATAKESAWKLLGWYARDPRLRSSSAWDCYFKYIVEELKI